jgi:hypothetical protein
MKKLFALLLFVVLPFRLLAQQGTEPSSNLSPHALGASGSMISGPGLSYEYIFGSQRIRLTAFAFYEKNGSSGYNMTGILGGEYQFDIQKSSVTRFYCFGGGHYWYEKYKNGDYIVYENSSPYEQITKDNSYGIGGGFGFEITGWERILFDLNAGIMYHHLDHTYTYSGGSSYEDPNYPQQYFGPGGGFAIYYRF